MTTLTHGVSFNFDSIGIALSNALSNIAKAVEMSRRLEHCQNHGQPLDHDTVRRIWAEVDASLNTPS